MDVKIAMQVCVAVRSFSKILCDSVRIVSFYGNLSYFKRKQLRTQSGWWNYFGLKQSFSILRCSETFGVVGSLKVGAYLVS